MPPGAPEEKHNTVVMTREININSSRPTLKFPAAAMGIRPKPPPAAFGSIKPRIPHTPPSRPPTSTHFVVFPPWMR